ncbi:MAG: hypothetical protein CSA50_05320 [Gammaproteobacteria bacterium]|nr:MAG: hypothetical protein CSA50_05320 [Gammaproteobacteria bacterium]
MKGAIAVLVKTPGLSPVKTRLSATIGHPLADRFFRLAKAAKEAILKEAVGAFAERDIALSCYWAIGEEQGVSHPMWQGLERMYTGPGGMGERMHHVYSTRLQDHDFVMLMGVDSPQHSVANLLEAVECLQQPDSLVIGPASDGGFYLFGGNTPVPLEHWAAVEYGREDTLASLLTRLDAYAINYTGSMTDVDTEGDLQRMVDEMAGELLPEQVALVSFVDRL